MKKLACNYSVIRFLPYPETEEFVNVGILACCPQVGWLDFVVEPRKTKRIGDFFPELDIHMYIAGRKHFLDEMTRLAAEHRLAKPTQLALPMQQEYIAGLFTEIIRAREELFRFGAPGTLLTKNPAQDMTALFNHYVDRHFAKRRDYQERIMTERLTAVFRQKNLLARYRRQRVGNDDYHVVMPFVETRPDDPRPARALKPLNLSQAEATQIRDHGDAWCAKADRLQKMDLMPRHMLFAVKYPPVGDRKRFEAAQEIEALLAQKPGIVVEDFGKKQALTRFAEQV
ncbi:MAG: DUF3037 domain-containing protein [Kiritimatiellae bacterium]|nr:DUF3037 domain-containing protein [Kiritimatiellia bacterium]